MPDLAHVQKLIEDALPGAAVRVEDFAGGGGDHLTAHVCAPQFVGLPLLARHRLVYDAVQDDLGSGAIHALSIKASTP